VGWIAVNAVLISLAEMYGADLENLASPERRIFQAQGAKAALLQARSTLLRLSKQTGEKDE